jgi:hypothetical protein
VIRYRWGAPDRPPEGGTLIADFRAEVTGLWRATVDGRPVLIADVGRIAVIDLDGTVTRPDWYAFAPTGWELVPGEPPTLVCFADDALTCYALDGTELWRVGCARPARLVGAPGRLAVQDEATGRVSLLDAGTGEPSAVAVPDGAVLLPERGRIVVAVPAGAGRGRLVDLNEDLSCAPAAPGPSWEWPPGAQPLTAIGDRVLLRRPGEGEFPCREKHPLALLTGGSDGTDVVTSEDLGYAAAYFGGVVVRNGQAYIVTGLGDEDHPLRLWRVDDLSRAARLPAGGSGPGSWRPPSDAAGRRPIVVEADGTIYTGDTDHADDDADDDRGAIRLWEAPADPVPPKYDEVRHHTGMRVFTGAVALVPGDPGEVLVERHSETGDKVDTRLEIIDPATGATRTPSTFWTRLPVDPKIRVVTVAGSPKALVNGSLGLRLVDLAAASWQVRTLHRYPSNLLDFVVADYPGHGPVLVTLWEDGVRIERLDDLSAIEPSLSTHGEHQLVVFDGRAYKMRGNYLEASYAYVQPGDDFGEVYEEWICGREIEVPGGGPARLLDADEHGRLLITDGETLHHADLATQASVGLPIPLLDAYPTAARDGVLHDRPVVLVLYGHGFALYDVATTRRICGVDLGAPLYDAVTAPPDSVVVVTERGVTGFEVDPFRTTHHQ